MKIESKTWQAIVFDFDGTLAGLNIDFALMRAAVLDLPLCRSIPEEKLTGLYTLEMIETAALIAKRNKKDASRFRLEAYSVIAEIEMAAARKGKLFPSTKTLLAELKKHSIKTGIITRNCRAAVLRVFPDVELYADATLTREDSQNVKPHPDHLQKALGILGVSEKDAAMVGDHPMDIMTARRAGSCAVGVLTGSADEKSLRAAGADLILANASAILGHL
ncbi:MAG: HAD family hydrolase [Syntrophales bacterium]|nr:HAD family hydrolase [Syntrophales bacterium]